jgi:hypothetical protein
MDRVGKLADEIPGLVISDKGEKPGLVKLSREIGLAFDEGRRMATTTDTALKTFDSVMARFDKSRTSRLCTKRRAFPHQGLCRYGSGSRPNVGAPNDIAQHPATLPYAGDPNPDVDRS